MPELIYYPVAGECRFRIRAHFIYYFKMDPPDCREGMFEAEVIGTSFVEAIADWWQQFKQSYNPEFVTALNITVDVEPRSKTVRRYENKN